MKKLLSTLLVLSFLLMFGPLVSAQDGQLAPDGESRETYYAPFAVDIVLDGETDDWAGVPHVLLSGGGDTSVVFSAAANSEYLFFLGEVTDPHIISGEHGENYWNEDSLELYLNGTGDLSLRTYTDGVAQITVPALNKDLPSEEAVLSGVRGSSANATVKVVQTETGYRVEMAVPLNTDVWSITPEHGGVIGFQVHLNGASSANRDTKLIWSRFDTSDQSYLNPSLFGFLIFYEIGQTDLPIPEALADSVSEPVPQVNRSALYFNGNLPTAARLIDLMARMTLEEKIAQMTLVEKNSILEEDIKTLGIGGLLSGGGGYPAGNNTPEGWAEMVNGYQELAVESRLGIPLIYGVDAVHGHSNVRGTVIFPHNIGLGATNNPALVEQVCRVTALEMVATGIYWNYSPVVAVPQDVRWGRTYETFGEDTAHVSEMALACLRGLQGEDISSPDTVIGTPKHYVGDGGAEWGTSTTSNYQIDQGVMTVDEATLRAIHLPPYVDAVNNGAQTIMISFSSWQDTKMHGQQYLITDVLKGELGFQGFIVSDWAGVDQVAPDYYDAVVASINAGVDMVMVPYDYLRFMETLKRAVNNGDVSVARIDDAVKRILTVKFDMGLFENPYANEALLAEVGSDEHRAVARQAVVESQVLLKNDGDVLPLSDEVNTILVAGVGADDIGIQAGGWTIEWQGGRGPITEGTTILEGVQALAPAGTTVLYSADGDFPDIEGTAPVGVVVVGEPPYAEGLGDDGDLTLSATNLALLETMRAKVDVLVVVIVSGRPLVITDHIDNWDAVVAAWLPGSEGAGVAETLFGYQPYTGTLPVTWLASVDQLPLPIEEPLFPLGYGLTTEATR
jgi:beta-glucosidase